MARICSGARVRASYIAIAGLIVLGGCAGNEGGGQGPKAVSLPAGKSCQSIRGELNRLDARGVPSLIESSNAGRKLSSSQRDLVDQYNTLLGQYLGAQCHV